MQQLQEENASTIDTENMLGFCGTIMAQILFYFQLRFPLADIKVLFYIFKGDGTFRFIQGFGPFKFSLLKEETVENVSI